MIQKRQGTSAARLMPTLGPALMSAAGTGFTGARIRSGEPGAHTSAPFCDRSMLSAWHSTPGPRASPFSLTAARRLERRTVASGTPFYQPSVTFTLTQPLLQKFGTTVTDQGILLALITSSNNRALFELQAITVSVQVIDAYWNLVNAREQLEIGRAHV